MRYILGLCAVLAIGNLAWTSEMGSVAGEPGYQTPASTVTSTVTQTTGTPTLPATSPVTQATGTPTLPATSPASAYQAATAQPATTTTSPAPTMMSPGTYTTGTQPVATDYATPMSNMMYTTNPYPMTVRRGLFGMRSSPMYYYPSTPVTTTYGTPVQTYTVAPSQTYYQNVRPRFGLFQRWRQQAMPTYGTPVYGTPTYTTSGYAAPVNTTYTYGTPAYYTTTYAVAGRDTTRERHDGSFRHDGREHNACLHADDTQRSEHNNSCHELGPRRACVAGSDSGPDGAGDIDTNGAGDTWPGQATTAPVPGYSAA